MTNLKIQDLKILVVGANGYWGKADTLEEALKNAHKPKEYVGYIVHPDTVVSEMGSIQYPGPHEVTEPKLVVKKVKKQ